MKLVKEMMKLNSNWVIVAFLVVSSFTYSQKEKEVSVKMGSEKLYGSLVDVGNKNAPVVIIIPGSGPTDRNGNSGIMPMKSYQLLAEGLKENGISTLRYDKLGVGKSVTKVEESKMVFEDNIKQVLAWISFLEKKKYNNIILLGHSEGSLIGILTAQQSDISKLISIAGTGREIDEVLVEQIDNQANYLVEDTKNILKQLKKGEEVKEIPSDLSMLFRESVQPYLISWLQLNPAKEIGKLKIPTLIVQGSTDIQVSVKDAELLHQGYPDSEYLLIVGMNHILKQAPADKNENAMTYYDAKLPLHSELIPALVNFIEKK